MQSLTFVGDCFAFCVTSCLCCSYGTAALLSALSAFQLALLILCLLVCMIAKGQMRLAIGIVATVTCLLTSCKLCDAAVAYSCRACITIMQSSGKAMHACCSRIILELIKTSKVRTSCIVSVEYAAWQKQIRVQQPHSAKRLLSCCCCH